MRKFHDRCFVVSEIGKLDSPERRRADQFLRIVKAALERVSDARPEERAITAERLDEDRTAANFFYEAVERILRYRLVVAVLSNRNPNAHLELGLALAAGRPLSILIEKRDGKTAAASAGNGYRLSAFWSRSGQAESAPPAAEFADLPSDLRGYACVECRIPATDDGPIDQDAVEDLAQIMLAQLKKGEPTLAFNRHPPFGKRSAVDYFNRASELSFEEWSRLLWDAGEHISIATTSMKFLVEPPGRRWFSSRAALKKPADKPAQDRQLLDIVIQKAAVEGTRVRLFVIHPDNPFLEHLVYARDPQHHHIELQRVRSEIAANLSHLRQYLAPLTGHALSDAKASLADEYQGLAFDDRGSLEIVEIRRGALFSRVTITDKAGFVTPYNLVEPFNTGPAFWVQNVKIPNDRGEEAENHLYGKALENLQELYACNRDGVEVVTNEQLRARIAA